VTQKAQAIVALVDSIITPQFSLKRDASIDATVAAATKKLMHDVLLRQVGG